MAKGTLVGIDIELGSRIVSALDAAGFPTTVALWLLNDEFGGWRLVLSSPIYEKLGPKAAYLRLLEVLSAADAELFNQAPVKLLSGRHSFVRNLRQLFGKAAAVEGMRLAGHSIGGVWVEDAYVYRIRK